MNPRDDIESLAKEKLKAYCKMLVIQDKSLDEENKAKVDAINRQYEQDVIEIMESGNDKERINDALIFCSSQHDFELMKIYDAAEAKNAHQVSNHVKIFMNSHEHEFKPILKQKDCHDIYILKAMQQTAANNVGGLDPTKLANALVHFEEINMGDAEQAKKYFGLEKIIQLYVIPAVFLAEDNMAKGVKNFMAAMIKALDASELDTNSKRAILKSTCTSIINCLNEHIENIPEVHGSTAERNIAQLQHFKIWLPVCEALQESGAFTSSKKKGTMFDPKSELSNLTARVKGFIEDHEWAINQDKKYQ